MADYYSLLSKLLDGLQDPAPPIRRGVYDRARRALTDQLKTVQPALTPDEIAREAAGLEDAIRLLETRYEDGGEAPAPIPAAIPILPSPPPAERIEVAPPPPAAPDVPRPPATAIRRGGRRRGPGPMLLGLVLLAIPVAVIAWLWRGDRPAAPADAPPPPVVAAAPASPTDPKYGERVAGGGTAPAKQAAPVPPSPSPAPAADESARRPPPPAATSTPAADPATSERPPAAPDRAPAASTQPGPDLAVAQRAVIFEENQIDPQQPIISAGRAVWRLDSINGGQGLPLETVIRGRVDLPAAGLTLSLVLRRNLDAALPASHTIELTFTTSSVSGNPARVVRDVGLPVMRPEEAIRGVSVAGLPVPVKENVFLIGLSDLKGDIERNTELLLRRNWMELPIRFASGQKAALLFDKGVSGERVFLDAYRQWGQAPPP